MDNQAIMDFDELSGALGAVLLPGGEKGFSRVAIDSRQVKQGSLFVCLKGERQDGHNYIESAFKSGASGIMAARSRMEDPDSGIASLAARYDRNVIVVEDTLKGLQDAAARYLEKFPNLVKVGITGSAGKTTTKEIAAALVGREKNTVMNSGNLNSETGMPVSAFNVRPFHELGIFEMGMNRRGEIMELAEVLKPQLALITNIGSAHIGILGTKRAIAEEKKNIFAFFRGTEKAFIPADEEYRDFLARGLKGNVEYYSAGSLKDLDGVKDMGLLGTEIRWAGKPCVFHLPGAFNLANAVAAMAIAVELGISGEGIRQGLESVKPLFGRGEIISGPVTVIRDCYNSNPESLKAAVDFCDSLDWPGRRVYIIGSMLELGDACEDAHRKAGRVLASSLAEKVFLYGEETETTAAVLASRIFPFYHTTSMEDLENELENYLRPGDLVLLKASRGCALERLVGVLLGEKERCPAGGVY
jgi:UDP-N-acetylmuramoyl-tripeptide--D-alanyl-D-alanine ligase